MFLFSSKLNDCTTWNKSVGGLANKTDNRTVSYKHRTGKVLVQIKQWCMYDYSIPDRGGETRLTSLHNKWTKNKIVLFLYYRRHDMNFHSCEKQILKPIDWTKIRSNSKWTQTSRNEVMQPRTSHRHSQPIFLYHVHYLADFDNPFINGRSFIYLGILKINLTF